MDITERQTFGELIRLYRRRAGLTQEELAERAELSPRGLLYLERDERHPQPGTARRLADALGLAGNDRIEFLAAGERVDARAADSSSSGETGVAGTLPVPTTPFVGREHELAEVEALLRDDSVRLLTLTGPGGTGKTRLAIEAARKVANGFESGVFFVSLGSVADPALVPSAIRSAMGLEEAGSLEEYLRGRRVLLVLDTLEHLLAAGSIVANLHSTCPKANVLVTSRVLLHLSGEHHFPVPPMALPPATAETTPDEVERYDATSLFLRRARAIDPHFAVTPQNAPVIRAICAQLDGLPLAIELAAARVSVLPLPALLDRLSDRLTLLSRGARDAPPRQQTMRATIDWSYRLLDAAQQQLLARLGIFAGGCTLEAAQEVCGEDGRDVFEDLSSLVESSLVRVVDGVGNEPRFLLLDTIREYAVARMEESAEAETIARRHAEFFVRLAEHIDDGWERVPDGVQQLIAERDNLRTALAWLRDHDEGVLGLSLVGALRAWGGFVLGADARTWLAAFEPSLPRVTPLVRARVLLLQALLIVPKYPEPGYPNDEAPIEAAVRLVEEAVAIYQRESDPWLRLRGLIAGASIIVYGPLRGGPGACEMADNLFRESLSLARRIGSVAGEGGALRGLGATANFLRNDLVEAEALTRESLAVETRAGRIPGMMDSLWALGGLAWSQGEYARALEFQTAVMAHRRALGWEIRDIQFVKGFTYLQVGEHESVLSIFREVRAACRISDYPDDYRSWLLVLASSSAQQGDVARAARLFGAVASEWGDEVYSPAARFTPMFEDYRESARGRLGEPAWSNLWEEGRALSLEQAVTYALEVSGGTRFTPAQSHPQRDLGDRSRL